MLQSDVAYLSQPLGGAIRLLGAMAPPIAKMRRPTIAESTMNSASIRHSSNGRL
jgi:hypothetical protein